MESPQEIFKGIDIVLASKSPRRRELMSMTGLEFSIAENIEVDESYVDSDLVGYNVPEFLSLKKAKAYQPLLAPGQVLITADTVVVLGDRILGKPSNDDEAKIMLADLSGKTHKVITGITLSDIRDVHTFSATTEVTFSELTEAEICYYVDRFHPTDKAGAYGIQEYIGAIGVERIEGSFYNVMGLPVHRLYRELETFVSRRLLKK